MEPASLVNPWSYVYLENDASQNPLPPKKEGPRPLTLIHQGVGAEMFQAIAELGNDGIFVFNEDYRVEYANRMVSKSPDIRMKHCLR
jgi:PAS domain-containing protein